MPRRPAPAPAASPPGARLTVETDPETDGRIADVPRPPGLNGVRREPRRGAVSCNCRRVARARRPRPRGAARRAGLRFRRRCLAVAGIRPALAALRIAPAPVKVARSAAVRSVGRPHATTPPVRRLPSSLTMLLMASTRNVGLPEQLPASRAQSFRGASARTGMTCVIPFGNVVDRTG